MDVQDRPLQAHTILNMMKWTKDSPFTLTTLTEPPSVWIAFFLSFQKPRKTLKKILIEDFMVEILDVWEFKVQFLC